MSSFRRHERKWLMQVVALYDYAPDGRIFERSLWYIALIGSRVLSLGFDGRSESDELPFAEGDVIRVLQVQDDGWWLGYLVEDPECMGLFPSNYVQQQRSAAPEKSVLQLKQSLMEAERASAAAREARLQAERERRRRQRRWEEDDEDGSDEQEEDEEEQDEKQEEAQENFDDENGPEEDEEDGSSNFQEDGDFDPNDGRWETNHNQQSARDDFPSSEEEEENEAAPLPTDAGSFSIPSEQRHMMNEVIDAYQARKQDTSQVNSSRAASRIARRYRIHRQDQHLRRHASKIIVDSLHRNATDQRTLRSRALQRRRQEEAAQLIQFWVRRRLADRRRDRLESHQRQEEDVAVRRLQHCTRRLLLRNVLRKKQQEEEKQAVIEQQASEPIEPSDSEEANRIEQENQALELQREQELIEQEHKKKVMKKEAMDLIKVLVNKQLETRLRDHDAKMLELQQLVTTLQDVVRTQSAMIRQSSDTILELEQAAAEVSAECSPQMLQRSNSIRSLKQRPMASQLPGPSATSTATSLPLLTKPQVVRTGSGIKPPRSIDIPSKLPTVTAHVKTNPARPRIRN